MYLHILLGVAVAALVSCYLSTFWGAPWAPTSLATVDQMLRLADLRSGETLIDLGAGDGRIVIRAARRFGARAIGIEIDPLRCLVANAAIRLLGLRGRAWIEHGNLLRSDLSGADVVTLYLLQSTNNRVQPYLSDQLQVGTRVVSHTFTFPGWTPVAIDQKRRLFVYEIGRTGPETQTRFVS